ncbi:acetolactate decarboxylase [Aspergillus thermomutatus]|uniref:Alpha-acetolactate decarboxylase n=1 Tax=Aspergillus thermomutatus TaxID=41047 RepID=A0A397H3P7_ASPTH|nr:uncharacterized protein CDV56_102345 [Aspergillus thermomutatus]RHZ56256.1 hypothetical protein CDV56_102345 [Aspergillus thermomutatus]
MHAPSKMSPNQIYQFSLIGSLMHGVCHDGIPASHILQKGTHGLGTVADLDGEIVVVDSEAYHFTSAGVVRRLASTDTIPFAMMTDFHPTTTTQLASLDTEGLLEHVSPLLGPGRNYFLAVRVDAFFPSLSVRIIPKRENPDEALGDLTRRQSVTSIENSTGSLVGFWSPEYTAGLSVAGFHLHYLSDDRRAGGHVLDFRAHEASVSVAVVREYHIELPVTGEFRETGIKVPELAEVEQAEGFRKHG